VIVKATQKAPEAREEVCGEEHKDKERYQVNIVSDLHNIVAPCDKESVEDRAKELEEPIGMHESC